ncbi:zinc ABC transporter substrate-binding protein [Beggiatoa leptomitoformis]|uniref:High-affinity zinc uptake system protein ZnuA n=1 Tax=Beggiatoa leptomitoformis TaxID=288004 RepID=A0A2N9YJ25_9GAMM|nr:zinc ABC transporter substrate-binding protein [Beggiatoa leptomitoformis]ALG67438.1 zinc ABC transporter substrate-binding protein [Beggiatoa leptomitoformis]AUI70345.1 zinc ABC transporter substrate-binding protein [Beggiatoa leptomitoformis]
MIRKIIFLIISLSLPCITQANDVVVSIKPIYALVTQIMAGVDKPTLLLTGKESPHTYTLKPSQVQELHQAKLVIWVSPFVEGFLAKTLSTLENTRVLQLSTLPDLTLLPIRVGGAWEKHVHHHDEDEHEHKDDVGEAQEKHVHHDEDAHEHENDFEMQVDGHIWLDPHNAMLIVRAITQALSVMDTSHAMLYQANAEKVLQRLDELDKQLKTTLAPVQDVPYVVFHDAYQYFERHYNLNAVGSITLSPENPPSAKRLSELRERMRTLQVHCVFSEPQFEPKLVNTLIEGTSIKQDVLDPEGANLNADENAYSILLTNLAQTLQGCLQDK